MSVSPDGCFDDGSYSVQLGSKGNAARLREDCRVNRRCLRQAAKLRIPGSGARNDRSAVQEAPEPTHFWTTADLGEWDRLRAGKDQFSRRPIVSSVHDNGRPVRRIRRRGEHPPRQGARHREDPQDANIRPEVDASQPGRSNPFVWMAEVNGLLVDLRTMPREVQEVAFAKGIIPYIPADGADRS